MARVIELKHPHGGGVMVDTAGVYITPEEAGTKIVLAGCYDGFVYEISYEDLRRLIATPGEFASYRDLDKADAKAPASGWQPIETVPRDGTVVDLWAIGRRVPGCFWVGKIDPDTNSLWWRSIHSDFRYRDTFTHWMPIPAGPEGGR